MSGPLRNALEVMAWLACAITLAVTFIGAANKNEPTLIAFALVGFIGFSALAVDSTRRIWL